MIYYIILAVVEIFLLISIVHSKGHLVPENIHGSALSSQQLNIRLSSVDALNSSNCGEGVSTCDFSLSALSCKKAYHLSPPSSLPFSSPLSTCTPCPRNTFSSLPSSPLLSCLPCSNSNIPCLPSNGLPAKGCPAGYFGNSKDDGCAMCGMGEYSISMLDDLKVGGGRNLEDRCTGRCSEKGFATCERGTGRGLSCLGGTVFATNSSSNSNTNSTIPLDNDLNSDPKCSTKCGTGFWAYNGNQLTECIPCHKSITCDPITGV